MLPMTAFVPTTPIPRIIAWSGGIGTRAFTENLLFANGPCFEFNSDANFRLGSDAALHPGAELRLLWHDVSPPQNVARLEMNCQLQQ